MRAVLDTNVLVSGIFFGGPPGTVLESWSAGRFELIVSPSILDEYLRTCERLASKYPGLEYESILATIAGHGPSFPTRPRPTRLHLTRTTTSSYSVPETTTPSWSPETVTFSTQQDGRGSKCNAPGIS